MQGRHQLHKETQVFFPNKTQLIFHIFSPKQDKFKTLCFISYLISSHLTLTPFRIHQTHKPKNPKTMRMSCNGCRVLRKGCSDDCTIRPCLQWIKSPDSQANATLFLAKFYGRAGLINLIEAGPPHLRPAIFRSLLYEACGRIVNPVYGSVGLLWAGNWAQCQAAVDAVFKGTPIPEIAASSSASASDHQQPPSPQMLTSLKAFDVRHVSRDPTSADRGLDKARGKRPVSRPNSTMMGEMGFGPMNESWMNQVMGNGIGFGEEDGSLFSLETVEGSLTGRAGANPACKDDEAGLDLTLGLV